MESGEVSSCHADNGAISPMIPTTNRSRVPSSRPRTDVRPNGKDARSNGTQSGTETMSSHAVFYHDVVQSYGHVVTRVSHHDESMRAVQSILSTKMPILLDCRSNMELFLWLTNTHSFRICM